MTRTKHMLLGLLLAASLVGSAFADGIVSSGPTTGQIPGTATNDNASTGNVGEFVTSSVASGSAVSLTTATPAQITSVSLTAGDWDCRARVSRTLNASTSVTVLQAAINSTTATIGTQGSELVDTKQTAANVMGALGQDSIIGPARISLSATTTEFLNVKDTFTVSTDAAYGVLSCRRVR